jgi:hypothetical protein
MMLRIIGLVVMLSAGLAQAEEVNAAVESPVESRQQVKKQFHPVRSIRRLHEHFVNLAIHLSSIGIEQPPEPPAPTLVLAETDRPGACTNLQLTALLTPPERPFGSY